MGRSLRNTRSGAFLTLSIAGVSPLQGGDDDVVAKRRGFCGFCGNVV